MRKIILLLVVLAVNQVSFAQDQATLAEIMQVYTSQYKFNGTVLVAQKGKILLNQGYGFRRIQDSLYHDSSSVFQIGSVTKQFTAAVILKLCEERKMDLRDKLSKYFPDFPKGDSISIHQLLSHTSGIYNYTNDGEFMQQEVSLPANRDKMMARFKDKPLDFSPGTKWNYSNSGYLMLGYIVEKVTGMSWENAVRQYIFKKAGMNLSGFDFAHLQSTSRSTGYSRIKATGNSVSLLVDSSVSFSAGSIYSTAGDLYKWFLALQADKIISKDSKKKAFTPVMNKYGYGWMEDTIAGQHTVGHSGGIPGFVSNMVFIPEDSTVIILLCNMNTPHLFAMTRYLLSVLYHQPYELPFTPVAIYLSEEELKQYVGVFELNADMVVHVKFEQGKLIGEPEGQEPLQLHPEKKELFFLKEIDAKIRFNRNETGEIISMTLLQNGGEMTGKKR